MNHTIEPSQWIAVLGGATRYSAKDIASAYKIGREIAAKGKNVMTGGTTGIPYAAAIGAKQAGALVVGVSPASSLEDHVLRFGKPLDYADLILYTGVGIPGRSSILMQTVLGSIFIGGEIGTLNEFTAGWMSGQNVLGVLLDADGISNRFKDILSDLQTTWGSKTIFHSDPVKLVEEVCNQVDQLYCVRRCQIQTEDIGKDVRLLIAEFIEQEKQEKCGVQSAITPIGFRSDTRQR